MPKTLRKAFILGAGLGTRLRPMTNLRPKPLVPIFHEPLVFKAIRKCREFGISEIMINTHHLPAIWHEVFPANFHTGKENPRHEFDHEAEFEGIKLIFRHEPVLLETGGGLKNIADWIKSDSLLMINGDVFTNFDFQQLWQTHQREACLATLALRSQGNLKNVGFDRNSFRVNDLRNSLNRDPGQFQFSGVSIVEPEILGLIPAQRVISIIPAFLELAKGNRLAGTVCDDGFWLDLGTPETYLEAHKNPELSASEGRIHPSAEIDVSASIDATSVIGARVKIGAGAKISHSVIWPDAEVMPGTTLNHAVITHGKAAGNIENTVV